ncbi:MAG: 23S rRNA (guanosine(2251)-2'-O)-methyltransferase RlmB [Defluviitaleaceae bacterium]|nr:23S rRNA (guanosine(2251)-2'-O)-methyltransferase RlmB [Defluviitaleaceae bacterium]MCL2239758.1 23S rRNA (guanosine(2251)-2'-O)-methyltransferase RlmB [Defluviitaleaceae bacterium]
MEIAPQSLILEGRKAVLEALNHEKPIDRILLRVDGKHRHAAPEGSAGGATRLEGTLRLIAAKARAQKIVVQEADKAKLDELSETGHHQGVIALCPAVPYVTITDILAIARERGEPPFVIVLDGVTDPHNLGAVMRSAEAGGVHGIIVPKRRAVGLTATVARTSAGAITHMAVARVPNITRALEELKSAGLWIACAGTGEKSLFEADLSGPVALVLGAEGEGVSRLVRQHADFAVGIPMLGKIGSLNVSVAAGVLVYEVVRQRGAGRGDSVPVN